MQTSRVFLAILMIGLSTGAVAEFNTGQSAGNSQQEPQGAPPGDRRPHGPPPEAVAACQGKASGASCRFIDRENQALTGFCFKPPAKAPNPASGKDGRQSDEKPDTPPLACRPERGDRGPGEPPSSR